MRLAGKIFLWYMGVSFLFYAGQAIATTPFSGDLIITVMIGVALAWVCYHFYPKEREHESKKTDDN